MSEFESVQEFLEALQLEVIESRIEPMNCLLCQTPTIQRVILMPPAKPARPMLGGVCELCQAQPGWEEEAALRGAIWLVQQGRAELLEGEDGED